MSSKKLSGPVPLITENIIQDWNRLAYRKRGIFALVPVSIPKKAYGSEISTAHAPASLIAEWLCGSGKRRYGKTSVRRGVGDDYVGIWEAALATLENMELKRDVRLDELFKEESQFFVEDVAKGIVKHESASSKNMQRHKNDQEKLPELQTAYTYKAKRDLDNVSSYCVSNIHKFCKNADCECACHN